MVLQIWCVLLVFERLSGFRNCVTSTDFVCKQLKKTLIQDLETPVRRALQ